MAILKFLTTALLAVGAYGQASGFTDTKTAIDYQGYINATGFRVGFALPQNVGTEFIGHITVPLTNGSGWGGVSLKGSMVGPLLIAAWPSGNKVIASFRQATKYGSPGPYNGTASMSPIASGTFVNTTHLQYTYRCSGCILGGNLTFSASDANPSIGWAYAPVTPSMPDNPNANLSFHRGGFGEFALNLVAARSQKYPTWVALASNGTRAVAFQA